MIGIERYQSGLLSSNMYLIEEEGHALVIDPFADTAPARGLTIDYILLTHEHYDHISGVNLWKEATGAPVFCSEACAQNIRDPKKNLASHFREFCKLQTWIELSGIPATDPDYTCEADLTFEEKTELRWRGHLLECVEIPGHSRGSIGILLDGKDFFSGDSLMENTEIELRMPGGSRKMWETVGRKRIGAVPDGTLIHPGHFDSFILHRTI